MIVRKFGGTSVKDATAIRQVGSIVAGKQGKCLVVASALSGVTNELVRLLELFSDRDFGKSAPLIASLRERHLSLANELGVVEECRETIEEKCRFLGLVAHSVDILGETTPKTKDLVLSTGELLSSCIIFQYLSKKGNPAGYADPSSILKTDAHFNEAEVDWDETEIAVKSILDPLFSRHDLVVTGGFVGSDSQGRITTLGRGGSDYSAAIFASVLGAEKLEIWTDVPGILTCDPRMVKEAVTVSEVSYEEASELAFFGAKVLHPKTIFPAIKANIPVYVLDTFRPGSAGTKIVAATHTGKSIKAIAFRKNITVINITSNRMLGAYGFLSKVFQVFDSHRTSVDLVSTSEVSISCTIDSLVSIDAITRDLEKFGTVQVFREKAIIAAIGEGVRDSSGIASRFFTALKGINISLVTMGASEINLSIVVDENELETAVRQLHQEFFSSR
jgi:aspartate kinase